MNSGLTLSIGSTGDAVRKLQRIFVTTKVLAPGNITGTFDSTTEQAVKDFQQGAGLTVDGIVIIGIDGGSAAGVDDGQPLMSDPVEIAAAYLFCLCRNHSFIDGNKRTALAACLVFLESNDLLPRTKLFADDWEAFVLDVAAGRLDRDQTTARLRKLLKQHRKPRCR